MPTKKEIKKIVIARLKTLSPDNKIAIGLNNFNRDELIEQVKKGNSIGKKIVQIELEFLRSLKKGIFCLKLVTENNKYFKP